jgi:hypothetical protein
MKNLWAKNLWAKNQWAQKAWALLLTGLLVLGGAPLFALDGAPASYASGTVAAFEPGTGGALNTVPPAALEFHAGQSQFSIPYAQITAFHYREESKLHIGILATIVVALFAPWEKVDRVTVVWSADGKDPQVATLVLSKHDGQGLVSILQARAQQACGHRQAQACGREW